jgi:hypothetical protein
LWRQKGKGQSGDRWKCKPTPLGAVWATLTQNQILRWGNLMLRECAKSLCAGHRLKHARTYFFGKFPNYFAAFFLEHLLGKKKSEKYA